VTPKQEAFCLAFFETGGDRQEALTRAGYKFGNAKNATETVSRMLKHPKIATRITELRARVVAKAEETVENHLETLSSLRDAALRADKFGPAIQAEIARGKVKGFYVEKVEMTATIVGMAEKMRARKAKQ